MNRFTTSTAIPTTALEAGSSSEHFGELRAVLRGVRHGDPWWAARMRKWTACDLSGLDLLVIQIESIHMDEDLILVAAISVDANGDKHQLGLVEGASGVNQTLGTFVSAQNTAQNGHYRRTQAYDFNH